MELPNQDDDPLRPYPMDNITQMMMLCELHIPMGKITVLVATTIVSLVDPDKSPPRIHGNLIQPGYFSVSVDRVCKDYRELGLKIPRGDGEKTLGQVEHSFILWRKHRCGG